MRVQVKKQNSFGISRVDAPAKIENVVVHEDFMHPDGRYVALYFRGQDASGIMKFGYQEMQELIKSLQTQLKTVKKSKLIKG